MSKLKTSKNDHDVGRFIAGVKEGKQRSDCEVLKKFAEQSVADMRQSYPSAKAE